MGSYTGNIKPIEELFKHVCGYIDESTYHSYFQNICEKYDNNTRRNFYANHWENATHRKLLQIFERLKFTTFLDGQIADDFNTRIYYPQIRTYLILTCFDSLGQPDKWRFFPDWISSKSKTKEREEIIDRIQTSNNLDFAHQLFIKYNQVYGVKRAFFRFIDEIIDDNLREQMFSKLQIRIIAEPSKEEIIKEDHELQEIKKHCLFKIRNDFTHNTYSKEALSLKKDKVQKIWIHRETYYKNKNPILGHHVATMKDYPNLLKTIVFNGIANRIKMNYGL